MSKESINFVLIFITPFLKGPGPISFRARILKMYVFPGIMLPIGQVCASPLTFSDAQSCPGSSNLCDISNPVISPFGSPGVFHVT